MFTIDTHSPNFCHLLFEAVYCREHCGRKPARHHLRGFRVYSRRCRICHPRKRQGSYKGLFCEYFEHNLYYARNLKTMDAQHYVAGPVRKRPKRLVHMAVADDAKQPEKRVPGAFLDWAAKPSFSFDEIFLPLIGKSR